MPRRLPADMPTVTLDRSLVAWWTLDALASAAMWAVIGFGICALVRWF